MEGLRVKPRRRYLVVPKISVHLKRTSEDARPVGKKQVREDGATLGTRGPYDDGERCGKGFGGDHCGLK